MLRARGIGYDTGFTLPGAAARAFDPAAMRHELEIIQRDLHCSAVRLFGNDLDRLDFAAGVAAELGLEIWFSPYPYELEPAEILALLADAAQRAEKIRQANADVVLVAGAEISLFNRGFLPGATLAERTGNLLQRRPEALAALAGLPSQINSFLDQAVRACRSSFEGKITYASVPFEKVDWAPFEILSVDAHRSKEVASIYQQAIRSLVAQGKPVAITEFGCTTYRGAADHGARGGEIAEYEGVVPVRLNGLYMRDEEEQAKYLRELLDVFVAENVDAAFVCTFACWDRPHRSDPRKDLDMASWGIVKILEDRHGETYPDLAWEPKAAFWVLADYYGRLEAGLEVDQR